MLKPKRPISIDGFLVDVFVSEEHSQDAELSKHATEKGDDITDHVRLRAPVLTVEGLVSDVPLNQLNRDQNEASSLKARLKFKELFAAKRPVRIVTSVEVYTDMVMTSLSSPENANTQGVYQFRATFEKQRFVTTERSTEAAVLPKRKRGVKTTDTSEEAPKPDEKATATRNRSVLKRIGGLL